MIPGSIVKSFGTSFGLWTTHLLLSHDPKLLESKALIAFPPKDDLQQKFENLLDTDEEKAAFRAVIKDTVDSLSKVMVRVPEANRLTVFEKLLELKNTPIK